MRELIFWWDKMRGTRDRLVNYIIKSYTYKSLLNPPSGTIHRVIRKFSKLSLTTHLMLDLSFEVQALGSLESFLHQIWIPIMGWGQIQETWYLGP